MRRRAPRTDANQPTIVDGLRERGVTVEITSALGNGFPDLVCGYRGLTVLIEVKLPQSDRVQGGAGGSRARLPEQYDPLHGFTPDERAFHARWTGQPIVIARCLDDALRAFGLA